MIEKLLRDAIPTMPPPDAICHIGICEQSECANCQRIAKALKALDSVWWVVTADFMANDSITSRAYGPYFEEDARKILIELQKEPDFVGGESIPFGFK